MSRSWVIKDLLKRWVEINNSMSWRWRELEITMSRWDELLKEKRELEITMSRWDELLKDKKGVGNNHVKMRWVIKRQKGSWK